MNIFGELFVYACIYTIMAKYERREREREGKEKRKYQS